MQRTYLMVLVLMVGVLSANDNSSAPFGFIPATEYSGLTGSNVQQSMMMDFSMEAEGARQEYNPAPTGKDTYTFTVVNWSNFNWFGAFCRGLDYVTHNGTPMLMTPSIDSDSLLFVNFDDGACNDKIPLDAGNTGGWGCYPYGSVNVNDYIDDNLYNSVDLGLTWNIYDNPAGSSGRGMDADYSSTLIWETSSSNGVYSFNHLSATGDYYDISAHIPGQMSGLTVYISGSYHFLIVNTYNSGYAHFFDLNDNLNFLGAVPYPYESFTEHSYGLAYVDTRDTFFWLYTDSANGNRYLVEMTLTVETSLDQTTWGDIKSTF